MNSQTQDRPNYFTHPSSLEDSIIRRIKGNFRQEMVFKAALTGGWESIPADWREHERERTLGDDLGMFDRKKKARTPASEYEQMSALGDDPKAWEELGNERLKQLVILKCIEYGVSQDASRIPMLFALYNRPSRASRTVSSDAFALLPGGF